LAAFLDLCAKFTISESGNVPDLVRKSFNALVHESILFLVLGYDYWFNPADQKAIGLSQAFLADAIVPSSGGSAQVGMHSVPLTKVKSDQSDDLPQLNLSSSVQSQIRSLWIKPDLALKKEVTGEAVDPQRISRGGFVTGGVANYNLCTRVLDLVADDFTGSGMATELQRNLSRSSADLGGAKRQTMVNCYRYLRSWWGDSDLTKIGLTPR
jgi:hypothetical protein